MAVNGPIPLERQLEVLSHASLPEGPRVIDVGCGTADLLIALARDGANGLGIDLDEVALRQGQAAAGDLPVRLRVGDAAEFPLPGADLVCCIGSTHAFGDGAAALTNAVKRFRAALQPGGIVLIGEGFHRKPLDPGYAVLLGSPTGIERTHAQNVHVIEEAGFTCLHATAATDVEWDDFEWGHWRQQLATVERMPVERRVEARALLTRWRDGYLRWGRDTMGFGLYLGIVAP